MRLPQQLAAAIETEALRFERKQLAQAVEELTSRYRENQGPSTPLRSARDDKPSGIVASALQRAAYCITRMPATFAALSATLQELRLRAPEMHIHSLLDLGSGPGTAVWAAAEHFPEIRSATLLERDSGFIALGEKMASTSANAVMRNAVWQQTDLTGAWKFPAHDLVVVSYALNELREAEALPFLRKAWSHAAKALLIVEPGTPHGFTSILRSRQELLAQNVHLAAPCPHAEVCPMLSRPGDWCHFSVRLERSALHRRLKSGELGYEDEKFSYLIGSRESVARAEGRILRHPYHGKGHIRLDLCGAEGWQQLTVTRKQGEAFKTAKKAHWGGIWP